MNKTVPIRRRRFKSVSPIEFKLGQPDPSLIARVGNIPKDLGDTVLPDVWPREINPFDVNLWNRLKPPADGEAFFQARKILSAPTGVAIYMSHNFISRAVTVDIVATLLIKSARTWHYLIANPGGANVWIGNAGVTVVSGFPIVQGETYAFILEEGLELYAVASGATQDVRILEL